MTRENATRRVGKGRAWRACSLVLPLFLLTGCVWDHGSLANAKDGPPAQPADSLIMRGDSDGALPPETNHPDLVNARDLYRQAKYAQARGIFRKVANNQKNTPRVAEEARFYEAECLRQEGYYPRAADTYVKMLNDFPNGAYREQAIQHMYEIANYWLDDTRKEMTEVEEKRQGKRWFVWPHGINFSKDKPLFDEEGRAIEKLEQVRYNDMTGPLADKALFLMGSVKFFNEDYKEADHYFTQIVQMHPRSEYAERACELAITSKHLSTGGSDYDGTKVAEARQLVQTALNNYPNLAREKSDFLEHQLIGITLQQAEKDYKTAEFYRRTGHPQSAYFYYEIVRRRYPGTKFFTQATERMNELRSKAEREAQEIQQQQQQAEEKEKQRQKAPPAQPETAPPPKPLPPSLETAPTPRREPGQP